MDNLSNIFNKSDDNITYEKIAESNAAIAESTGKTLQGAPLPIHVG